MKKFFVLFLVFSITLFCCSCGSKQNVATDSDTQKNAACNHVWEEATCTFPKTCTLCAAVDGLALGHNIVDYKCSRCSESFLNKEDIPNIIDFTKLTCSVNMVGGINVDLALRNKYAKIIKYITFEVEFYNAVGDVIRNQIGNYDSAKLEYTGPCNPNQTDEAHWEACFYNSTFSNVLHFREITIEYMDGTKITIPSEFTNYTVVNWRTQLK